jgi:hypothetical protein
MRKLAIVILLSILSSPLFSQQHLNTQVATWEPKFDFDNELYPSYILATSGMGKMETSTPDYFGDSNGIAEVWVVPSSANAQVHVEIKIEGWTEVSKLDAILPEAGKKYRLAPLLRFDFDRLMDVYQSVPATVAYSVSVNGTDLGQEGLSVRVRSVNDVPCSTTANTLGGERDLTMLFAGYVNESHPFIQTLLQEALRWKAVNEFTGYQKNDPAEVTMQVFSIWNVLQRRQVRYSSTTTPSAESPSGQVFSQSVRFLDQSIDSQQANCVDGSVLFASVLYKIGIEPVLVLMPGHMFVGYWGDRIHKQIEFLETTKVGVGPLPGPSNWAFGKYLHTVEGSNSWSQFQDAINYAENIFLQKVRPEIQKQGSALKFNADYKLIDIAAIRKLGINAIPRPNR